MTKWLYLSPEAENEKNKGTFFSSTFKVEEKKVPLFFSFSSSGLRYSQFCQKSTFKNHENLKNVKNKEKYIKIAISQSYGLQTKI